MSALGCHNLGLVADTLWITTCTMGFPLGSEKGHNITEHNRLNQSILCLGQVIGFDSNDLENSYHYLRRPAAP